MQQQPPTFQNARPEIRTQLSSLFVFVKSVFDNVRGDRVSVDQICSGLDEIVTWLHAQQQQSIASTSSSGRNSPSESPCDSSSSPQSAIPLSSLGQSSPSSSQQPSTVVKRLGSEIDPGSGSPGTSSNKKRRTPDISKRMRSFYLHHRSQRDPKICHWDSLPLKSCEGYAYILTNNDFKEPVTPVQRAKMINSLNSLTPEKLSQLLLKYPGISQYLTREETSNVNRLQSANQTPSFSLESINPQKSPVGGKIDADVRVNLSGDTAVVSPRHFQLTFNAEGRFTQVNPNNVYPNLLRVIVPPCPAEVTEGKSEIPATVSNARSPQELGFSYTGGGPSQTTAVTCQSAENGGSCHATSMSKFPTSTASSSSSTSSGGMNIEMAPFNPGGHCTRKNELGQVELHRASYYGHFERVLEILRSTPDDVNLRDNFGRTPVHYAAFCLQANVLRCLIFKGGSTILQDYWGLTPSHIYSRVASQFGETATIDDLFEDDEEDDEEYSSSDEEEISDEEMDEPMPFVVVPSRSESCASTGNNVELVDTPMESCAVTSTEHLPYMVTPASPVTGVSDRLEQLKLGPIEMRFEFQRKDGTMYTRKVPFDAPEFQRREADISSVFSTPIELENISDLKKLDLSNNKLKSLPDSIALMMRKTEQKLIGDYISGDQLNIHSRSLTVNRVMDEIHCNQRGGSHLQKQGDSAVLGSNLLKQEYSANNELTTPGGDNLVLHHTLSSSELIQWLPRLHELDISYNEFDVLPDSILSLSHLTHLNVSFNKLTKLPDLIGNLSNLQSLNVSSNELVVLPDSIVSLSELRELDVSSNKLQSFPDEFGSLIEQITYENFKYGGNPLTEIPAGSRAYPKDLVAHLRESTVANQLQLIDRSDDLGKAAEANRKLWSIFVAPHCSREVRSKILRSHFMETARMISNDNLPELNWEMLNLITPQVEARDFEYSLTDLVRSGRNASVFKAKLRGENVAMKIVRFDQDSKSLHQIQWGLFVMLMTNCLENQNLLPITGWHLDLSQRNCTLFTPLASANLRQFISSRDSRLQSVPSKLELSVQIGEGLKSLHQINLAHGAIKPENVLIFENPEQQRLQVKLCDFGVSRAQSGDLWSAPESVGKAHGDRKSDIYSLGMLLSYIFTGTEPQTGKPWHSKIAQQMPTQDLANLIASCCSDQRPEIDVVCSNLSEIANPTQDVHPSKTRGIHIKTSQSPALDTDPSSPASSGKYSPSRTRELLKRGVQVVKGLSPAPTDDGLCSFEPEPSVPDACPSSPASSGSRTRELLKQVVTGFSPATDDGLCSFEPEPSVPDACPSSPASSGRNSPSSRLEIFRKVFKW